MFGLFKKTEAALKKTRDAWLGKVTGIFDRKTIGEDFWDELEEVLISADIGVATTDRLVSELRDAAKRGTRDPESLREQLKAAMVSILRSCPAPTILDWGKPQIVVVVGVNGSGKTTTIAKLANYYKTQDRSIILAAADTFRAAAIDQIQLWGSRIGVEVISNKPGGDPAAVVFDAIQSATSRKTDIVIVDTAGRLHTKFNLMEELKKIKRTASKASAAGVQTLLVLDATTGQNGLIQAEEFTKAVDLTGILLTKLDGTAKGGIALSVCDRLKLPILFIGTGESVDDLTPFDPEAFVEAVFGSQEGSLKKV